MNNRLYPFAGTIRSSVHVREEGDGRHAGFAGSGGQSGNDVTVFCHLHVARTHFDQFLPEHLEQHQLAGGAGISRAGLV